MEVPSPQCGVCESDLMPEARFCASCGAPTPTGEEEGVEHPGDDAEGGRLTAEYDARLTGALASEYEVLEVIGQGGFARVYKARDLRLGRLVALKVIRPDLAGAAAFADRFRREGVALAKLRHPGVVPIYDIGESDDLIYYVMPFVDGENLGQKLQRHGRIPPVMAHRILSELSDAIAAAHREGIVHRDIKPENVILEGNIEKVLLMDFGIAKALSEGEEEGLTGRGVLVGTPRYMSPEQAAGADEIDHRADIYSLGVLAYHMVTGKVPFEGTSTQQIIVQHITDAPTPVRHLNPSVSKGFADAIMRCLAKDPWDRFQTAMDLWRALQAISFLPSETALGTAKPMFPRRVVVTALALLGIAVGVVGDRVVPGMIPSPPPPRPPTGADAQAFVQGWLGHLAQIAAAPSETRAVRRTALSAFDSSATTLRIVADRVPGVVVLHPEDLLRNGVALSELGDFRTAEFNAQTFGDVWVLTALDKENAACRGVSITLRFDRPRWTVLGVSSGISC